MPFNSGGQTYQGGNFLFAGLSGLGKGIGDAIEKAQEQSKLESYNDSIVQHAYQSGQVDLEGLTKYRQMGHTQKTGYAASLAANFAEDMKREQLAAAREARQAQAEQRAATADLRTQQAAAFNWTPDEAAKQAARWTNNELVQTGPGKFQPVAYGDASGDGVGDVEAKEVVPGWMAVSRPGSKQFQMVPKGQGGLVQDPKNPNAWGVLGSKNNFVPLTLQQRMAMLMGDIESPVGTTTPPPAGGTAQDGGGVGKILDYVMASFGGGTGGAMGGGGPAATPAPAVAAATGNEVAKVKVKSPDGKLGYIPAAQLEAALRQGYTRAQ